MEPKIKRTARDTVLTLTLAALLGGGILFFLNVVSLGILSCALGVGGLVAAGRRAALRHLGLVDVAGGRRRTRRTEGA